MGDKLKKTAKMAGYLEKRGKMTFTGRWKRWWCVLERHLLLYYKSQREYSKLSPCCGSLNVALVRSIQPNMGCQIHIVTHSQRVILRTRTKEKQQQWFHALVSVLPQNDYKIPALDNFSSVLAQSYRKSERWKKEKLSNYDRRPESGSSEKSHAVSQEKFCSSNVISSKEIRSNSEEQLHTTQENRNEVNVGQNTKMFEQLKKLYIRNRKTSEYSFKNESEPHCEINFEIRRYSSYHSVTNSISEDDLKNSRRSYSCECIFTSIDDCTTDARSPKNYTEGCKIADETSNRFSKTQEEEFHPLENNLSRKILRKRIKKTVVTKRTFSFFKKILSKPKPKYLRKETDRKFVTTENPYENYEIGTNDLQNPISELQDDKKTEHTSAVIARIILNEDDKNNNKAENTNESVKTEECQSWTMIQDAEFSKLTENLPTLPTKEKINSPRYSLRKQEIKFDSENDRIDKQHKPRLEFNTELDVLLMQLTDMTNESNYSPIPHFDATEEPDYDIPRPHTSLIGKTTEKNASFGDAESKDESNDNLCSLRHGHSISMDMAPDSLEMPWLSNTKTSNFNYWSSINDYHFCLENSSESENEDVFQDSLNPIKNAI